jgi:hypothetical protein
VCSISGTGGARLQGGLVEGLGEKNKEGWYVIIGDGVGVKFLRPSRSKLLWMLSRKHTTLRFVERCGWYSSQQYWCLQSPGTAMPVRSHVFKENNTYACDSQDGFIAWGLSNLHLRETAWVHL